MHDIELYPLNRCLNRMSGLYLMENSREMEVSIANYSSQNIVIKHRQVMGLLVFNEFFTITNNSSFAILLSI